MKSKIVAPSKMRAVVYRRIKIQPIVGKRSQTGDALHDVLMATRKAVE
jgi:hypothetical protein